MDDIRVVELFAGVGGFRLGLETASERFKIIWATSGSRIRPSNSLFCAIRVISVRAPLMYVPTSLKSKGAYPNTTFSSAASLAKTTPS